ncbi:MAG: formate dehydrogenase accessory protein FdhE [Syntrophomonadaceae bacterium]|nr:formate dehydrogenase accessory protein FdhE [Syntrophomonadaceae bacterium]
MLEHKIPVELPAGYIDFFKNLESWQNEEMIKLRKVYQPEKKDILRALNDQRKPFIIHLNPHIEADAFKDVLSRLLDFLKDKRPEIQDRLELIARQAEKLDYEDIVRSFLQLKYSSIEEIATRNDLPAELFFFVIDHAMRPFLRLFAEPYGAELVSDNFYWDFPATCPVCGSKSHFSRLRTETGQRFMFCDRCFAEWKVRYIFCVHCGHDRPGDITFLTVENDDAYRLYVCDKCKGYLKTYDERPGGETTDLFIANIETIYLDLLAKEKGYTNHEQ